MPALQLIAMIALSPGLRNLPLYGYDQNKIWCEVVALACELLAWTQMLALPGPARRWEPRKLRTIPSTLK